MLFDLLNPGFDTLNQVSGILDKRGHFFLVGLIYQIVVTLFAEVLELCVKAPVIGGEYTWDDIFLAEHKACALVATDLYTVVYQQG